MAIPMLTETSVSSFGDALAFVFRNFPLIQVHPHALGAAAAAEAAALQGRFWPMHDTLFAHQDALDLPDLRRYARDLGLDVDRFTQDVESQAYASRIQGDVDSGMESGVQGTPTFFINGRMYEGSPQAGPMVHALRQAADPRR